jgi:hypothetical protein
MLPCYIKSSFISPVIAVAPLRGESPLMLFHHLYQCYGIRKEADGQAGSLLHDPRHCSRTARSSRMVKSGGCELHAPRPSAPDREHGWRSSVAAALQTMRHGNTGGGKRYSPGADTTSTRSGSVTPRTGSRARLAQQRGCRTPDDASRQSGREAVPG